MVQTLYFFIFKQKPCIFLFFTIYLFCGLRSSAQQNSNVTKQKQLGTIVVTAITTAPTCNYFNGSIILNASGGTPPYTYNFEGSIFETGYFPNLRDGNYYFYVSDATGTTVLVLVTLPTTPNPLVATVASYTDPTGCGTADGTVTLSITGGTPPYQYSSDGVNFQSSNVLTNLPPTPGYPPSFTYPLTVKDANGCTTAVVAPHLAENCAIIINGMDYTSLFYCNTLGSITITSAIGGSQPYTYSIDGINFQTSNSFTNLPGGFYKVYVRDAGGLTDVKGFYLAYDCLPQIHTAVTNSSCQQNNGSITVTAGVGTPPYTYTIGGVNFQTTNIFTGLSAGYYNVSVKDAMGAINSGVVIITGNCPIVTATETDATCNQNNGTITASPSNGTAPYLYSIDGVNFQNSNVFNNLAPNTYTVSLKDAKGFINTFQVTIKAGVCAPTVTATSTNTTCGNSNGSITAIGTGGTAPYTYSINGQPFQNSGYFHDLAPVSYVITIKDASGQTNTTNITLTNTLSPPTISVNYTNTSSCTAVDGTLTAVGAGGVPPYKYSIDNIHYQSSGSFTNLAAGNYIMYVTDVNGCFATFPISIYNNCGWGYATTNSYIVCGNTGTIDIFGITGATAPFSFSLNGGAFQTSGIFNGLAPGIYTVVMKDANGLTNTAAFTIFNGCIISVTTTVANALCGQSNGGIIVNASAGTPPYQYSIDGINFQSSNIFSNLPKGTYMITVKDVNGNTGNVTVVITENCPVLSAIATNSSCNNNNGIITTNATGGTSPYQYSIDGTNFQSGNIFTNLAAAVYNVTVKDANGFKATIPVIIQSVCIIITPQANSATCGNNNGSILVNATGGISPYQYSIDGTNFQSSNNFTLLGAAIYTITVKDANGLSNTTSATINKIPGPQINATAKAASCLNNDGQVSVLQNGGTAPFQYALNNGSFQADANFNNLDTGIKIVSIKDANGCLVSSPVLVSLNDQLSVDAGNDITICEGTGSPLNAISNGMSFSWSPTTGLSNAHGLNTVASPASSTKYFLTAVNGICSKTDSVFVFVNPAPIADAGTNDSICFGKSTQLNGSGGINYTWSPSSFLDNPGISTPTVEQPANSITYDLSVQDINGCNSLNPAEVTVTVTPPTQVFAGNDTAVVINQSLPLNAVDVNSSGFTRYIWSPTSGLSDAFIQNPSAIITGNILYTVMASTPDGCVGTDSIFIKMYPFSDIFVPNAFTPNGDGNNDKLNAITIGIKELKYFAVYNRWGQRIFFSESQGAGWDGTLGGKPQDSGTYVWMVAGVDYKGNLIQHKGTVVLIR